MVELTNNVVIAISTAGTIAFCLCCLCVLGELRARVRRREAREALVASATAGVSATLGEPVVMA